MRHFLTTDLDAETIVGLHLALRQVGWMDQSQVGGPSVDATTSSLLIGSAELQCCGENTCYKRT